MDGKKPRCRDAVDTMLNPRARPAVAMEAMIAMETAAWVLVVAFILLWLLNRRCLVACLGFEKREKGKED